jgi:hypothetical protein
LIELRVAPEKRILINERHYSGKKKRHTRKHTVMTTPDKQIIVLSPAREGKVHDKRQLAEEKLVDQIPDKVTISGDLGYQCHWWNEALSGCCRD